MNYFGQESVRINDSKRLGIVKFAEAEERSVGSENQLVGTWLD